MQVVNELAKMLAFLAAIFFLLITPGPGVLSTAGVSAAFGAKPAYRYVTGLFIGTNLVALAVVTGVAGLMLDLPVVRPILLYASALYLLYLAGRIALEGAEISFIEKQSAPGLLNGIALQAINPKAYVVNTTLFTSFPFAHLSSGMEVLWKFALINAVWIPIHLLWLAAGIALKKMSLPHHVQRRINIFMGLSLLIVVILAVLYKP